MSFGKSWSKFGIPKTKIILYDGLEEVSWLKGTEFEKPKFLQELAEQETSHSLPGCRIQSQLLQRRRSRLTTSPKRTIQTSHSSLPPTVRRRKRKTQRLKQRLGTAKTSFNRATDTLHRPDGWAAAALHAEKPPSAAFRL